jgi:hypothetical protein
LGLHTWTSNSRNLETFSETKEELTNNWPLPTESTKISQQSIEHIKLLTLDVESKQNLVWSHVKPKQNWIEGPLNIAQKQDKTKQNKRKE